MKRNSAAFLALFLSAAVAAAPSAAVMADTEVQGESTAQEAVSAETEETEAAAETAEAEPAAEENEEAETAAETAAEEEPAETTEAAAAEQEEETEAAADSAEAAKSDEKTDTETKSSASEAAEEKAGTDSSASETAAAAETEEETVSGTYGISTSVTNAAGTVSGMYTMDSVTVTEQSDGTCLVRMHQQSANRNILAVTSDKAAATAHEVDWNVGGGSDGYWFVIQVSSLTDPVYFCMSSTERIADGKEFGNIMTLTFDVSSKTAEGAVEVTKSEMNVDPVPGSETGKDADDEKEETGEDTKDGEDNSKTLENGIYTGAADTGAQMFKVTAVKLTVKDGAMTAVLTLSGTGYDYLYLGTKEEAYAADESSWIPAVVAEDGTYTYEIPVSALDKEIAIASRSKKYAAAGKGVDAWIDRTVTIHSSSLIKIADLPSDSSDSENPSSITLADGTYTGSAETGAKMFKVSSVNLTVKNGKMTAVLTLSGTGYDYLYLGTKEEAYAADESSWIPAVVAEDGTYTYEIPVSALDKEIAIASRSKKYAAAGKGVDAWIDRTVTILSSSLTKTGGSSTGGNTSGGSTTGGSTSGGNKGGSSTGGNSSSGSSTSGSSSSGSSSSTTKNDGKAESESKYETDLSGSTSAVNSSTTIKDGVYTPSSFSWSGGTGRVSISCSKVTVTNGKASATIAFSSTHYSYVKANGNTYYPTVSGGSSVFTIPVELNKNQTIIGMTTAMSSPHEITYSIFVALAADGSKAADTTQSASGLVSSDNTTLDEEAPEIVGLEYESETELEEAEYFKIYNYENGITLLEIDMTKDTERDPEGEENQAEDSDNKDTTDKEDADEEDAEETNTSDAADDEAAQSSDDADDEKEDKDEAQSQEEITAELYTGNVVKYLIVPEDEEVPTGIEKDMIVIQLPAEKLYAAADSAIDSLEDLDSLDLITAVAVEEEDCGNKTIAEAMGEEEIIYGGQAEKPAFKKLVKAKTDLALMPETLLPGNPEEDDKDRDEEDLEEELEDFESLTEKFALLGIPVVFDRSADEDSEIAEAEWIKVYGVLTDKQEAAEKIFNQFVEDNQ